MNEVSVAHKVFGQSPALALTKPAPAADALIRYAQCWEDADVLLAALAVKPGDVCLSIASGGENSLSLLSKSPSKVIALDCNPAQLACLELKAAAFRNLSHGELLRFLGSRAASAAERRELYTLCAADLEPATRRYWRENAHLLEAGINTTAKFENYFRMFRQVLLPLIHDSRTVEELCAPRSLQDRHTFYLKVWNTWRWRALFSMFFSRKVMGNAGRDPQLFKFVEGNVSSRILDRVRHGLTEVAPETNPYLQWILFGEHRDALPHALREENFQSIRANLDALEWHCLTVGEYLEADGEADVKTRIDCFNLSDIFEYMGENDYLHLLNTLIDASNPGARLAYWNMLVDRQTPQSLVDSGKLLPHKDQAAALLAADKAFFYSNFVLEEVCRT